MTLVEIEELIRRYLSTGITAVVIIVGPGAGAELPQAGNPDVVVVEPGGATPGSAPGGTSGPGDTPGSGDSADPGTDPGTDPGAGTGADGPDAPPAGEGVTAAERYGWGHPDRKDDFSGTTAQWDVYAGPGHAEEGMRSPSAVTLDNGVLTITGDADGTTGGMAWNPGQKYGRWEARVKAPRSDKSYDALLLLWPDAEDFPVGGEIDFMEMQDPTRQTTDMFLHYGADNSQVHGQVEIDATEWHNWAVEWTPDAITTYVDGVEWFRTTDTSTFPPGPMHLSIQLDWFPEGGTVKESTMMVDWVRQYSLDGAQSPSTGSDSSNPLGSDRSGENPEQTDEETDGQTGGTGPDSGSVDGEDDEDSKDDPPVR